MEEYNDELINQLNEHVPQVLVALCWEYVDRPTQGPLSELEYLISRHFPSNLCCEPVNYARIPHLPNFRFVDDAGRERGEFLTRRGDAEWTERIADRLTGIRYQLIMSKRKRRCALRITGNPFLKIVYFDLYVHE
jgi:hypothetical protein